MCKIHVGGESHEFLSVEILGCASADDEVHDYWDENWLAVLVEVRAGGFQGSVSCQFQAEELVQLRERLDDLFHWKEDSADFTTLESWLAIRFMIDKHGRITVLGDLIDRPLDGNRLRFELSIDQSFLPSTLRDLDHAIKTFPVIGTPPIPQ